VNITCKKKKFYAHQIHKGLLLPARGVTIACKKGYYCLQEGLLLPATILKKGREKGIKKQ